jgi:putative ABC transport system permease protein
MVNSRSVAVAAFDPAATKPLTAYWHVEGTRDIHTGECLAGELLGLPIGTNTQAGVVKGIVSTGSAEDNELLTPLDPSVVAVSLVEIRAPGDRLASVREALAQQFPEASVRTVASVAETESAVVTRIRAAVFLLSLLILVITTLCVASNFSEMVIERSQEIGILKALGALEGRITAFFLSESAALALLASLSGYVAGIFTAALIGSQIFGTAFHIETSWMVPLAVTVVMLTVAALATAIATAKVRNIQPAIILRGE